MKKASIPSLFTQAITSNTPASLTLAPFQVEGVYRIAQIHFKKRNACLLGDDMGVGKTIQAISLFNYLEFKKVLIICPASVTGVWETEVPKWSSRQYNVQILNSSKAKLRPKTNIAILSYALTWRKPLLKQLVAEKWDLVIYDEAHCLANLESKQVKACLGNIWAVATNRLPMTGSVMRNKTIDLFPLFARIAPELFPGDRWAFARRFCHIESNKWGTKILGGKNLGELNKLAKDFTVRRTKAKVLPQLPEKLEQKIYIDCPWAEQEADDKALKDFTEAKIKKAVDSGHIDPEMAKARARLGIEKVDGIVDYLEQKKSESQDDFCHVVFCHHRTVWSELSNKLKAKGFSITGIHGGIPKKKRPPIIKKFQDGKSEIFLATFAAAEGITLTRASQLAYAEMSWSLDKNEQAADRLHRMGQKKQVYITYLLARHEMDEVVFASYKQKSSIKKRILA